MKINNIRLIFFDLIGAVILAYAGYYIMLELWCAIYGLLM
jgi:hypothetical protein